MNNVHRRPFRPGGRVLVSATSVLAALLLPFSSAAAVVPGSSSAPRAAVVRTAALPAAETFPRATSFDAQMVVLVNNARTAAGVPKLTVATGLTDLSAWWSTHLESGATGYQLKHNPDAWTMVTTYGAANRKSWGENVAWSSSTATTAQQIFDAYMKSPGHRANILASGYRYVGMGTVTGAHGLFTTTEFTDAVQPGQAVVPIPADGTFVLDTSNSAVYVMVGGAPVYVSSWAVYGGMKSTTRVSHAQLATWPVYPKDGTFIVTPASGAVYRIVGGAPIYVSSWAPFGGSKPVVRVDPAALARAGSGTYWNHLAVFPRDGSFIRNPFDGAIYTIAGGAPVYVSSWAFLGGSKPTVDVDPAAIARAGSGSYYQHLANVPRDGTYINTPGSGAVYVMAGGAPLYVASWAPLGGTKYSVPVDPSAVAHSGAAGRWAHLNMYPATPTYLRAVGTPEVYQVRDGVATHLMSWSLVGGPKPVTVVHPLAISLRGTGGYYNHLK